MNAQMKTAEFQALPASKKEQCEKEYQQQQLLSAQQEEAYVKFPLTQRKAQSTQVNTHRSILSTQCGRICDTLTPV